MSAIYLCLISANILTGTIGGFKFIFHNIVIKNIELGGNIQSGYIYSFYLNLSTVAVVLVLYTWLKKYYLSRKDFGESMSYIAVLLVKDAYQIVKLC